MRPALMLGIWALASSSRLGSQRDVKEILKLFSFKQLLSSLKILKEAFYDDNGITIDGHTDLSFTEDVGKRFEGYGWQAETQCQKLCY